MKGLHLLLSFLWFNITICQSTVLIVDEDGQPLIGVSVYSRDQTFQTISDQQGVAHLPQGMSSSTILYFQFLGYKSQQLSLQELSDMDYRVQLMPGLQLEEVVIVGRAEESSRMTNQVHKVERDEILLLNQQTPADVLAASGQVFVQKSQMGGGSPILRGFEANKVLLVVDGVRMNNAIYRNGHLHNAITIDGSALDNVSVIFGPGSLKYGSDAIGGVMHFQTRVPRLSLGLDHSYSGMVYGRTSSANGERTFHADLEVRGAQFASWTSVTGSKYGDLKTGGNRSEEFPDFGKRFSYVERRNGSDIEVNNDDVNVQIGTAYEQLDLIQKLLYQKSEYEKLLLNLHYSTSSDVPRYDALIERSNGFPRWAEWNYGPQKRWMSSLSYTNTRKRSYSDLIHIIGAYQNILETRNNRRFMDDIRERQDEYVQVFSLTTDIEKSINQLDLQYGFEVNHNIINSEAEGINMSSGVDGLNILTRYPSGDNAMSSMAAYLAGNYNLSDRSKLLTGIRWTRTTLEFDYLNSDEISWPDNFYSGISSSNNALTWSLGVNNHFDNFRIQAMIATAFRSPNLDDMAKIRVNGIELTAPNPELEPEKTLNTDLTIGWSPTSRISWSNTIFFTELSDAIVRAPFSLPDGSTTFIDGPDTLTVVGNINAQKARVYGISSRLVAKISARLNLDATYNWTRGRILSNETSPLSHIPPSYGKIAVNYSSEDHKISIQWRYNLAKPLSEYGGSADNPEYATQEGTLTWNTLNLYHKWMINEHINIDVGLENIFDRHYRTFASGVSAPGRNLIITGRFLF
ncbi:MAG: TonB-dependent receptor [Saprospiraceae bacterium]|nr:TonB-dependent receptor [Saprospiraceae bacterium]